MNTAILLLVVTLLEWTTALSVQITPEHIHLTSRDDPLTVRCVADAPITHCQFRVSDEDTLKPVVDLSSGPLSNVRDFKYMGDGLSNGHCGATIRPAALSEYWKGGAVECRVRSNTSDWVYATMSLYRSPSEKFALTIESRLVVVRPGGEVSILFEAEDMFTNCGLIHPQQHFIDLAFQTTCVDKADSVCYHGRGTWRKECGVTTKNITDRSNGRYWFLLRGRASGFYERTHVQVIVTKPPSKPVLSANTTVDADGISTLTAVCTVAGSRPAANITWILGGEVVTGGNIIYLPRDTWVMQYEEQTTIQQLTLIIDDAMHGKDLGCIANHIALALPIRSNKVKVI